ncbi:MAG: hypothetical protein KDD66_10620 [Bdellovibrionales bacterium]|nr:hypothetical protein [Bdellovibrionales bacterium]
MKILVFTTDIPPLPGLPTSGTALRTFGIAEGLRSHGHEVVLSPPSAALAGLKAKNDISSLPQLIQDHITELESRSFDSFNQHERVADIRPDVILCGHWPAFAARVRPHQAVVVDLAGPHMLERHYQKAPDQNGALLAKLSVLASADYFIVSGPSQQSYFYSYMSRAGVEDPAARTVTITMPLSPELPQRPPINLERFPRFLFGGVFLPWQDPSAGLRQLSQTLAQRGKGSLTLIGGKHPNYDVDSASYRKLFEELNRNELITCKPMLPFEQFVAEMSNADIAIDVMGWNLERQLAMTIRSTTYLWAGLPTIYNNFADLGALIEKYDAGWLVDPADRASLEQVFSNIYANPEQVSHKSRNAQKLAAEVFAWDKAVQPLLRLLDGSTAVRSERTDIMIDSPELADFALDGRKSFQQYFVCRMPGLSEISCKLATHRRSGCKSLIARLYRYAETSGRRLPAVNSKRELVFEELIHSERIHDSAWISLKTQAIENSDGATFMFELEAAEGPGEQPDVFPWVAKASPYPLIGAVYGGKKIDQIGMCFRTSCSTQGLR